MPLLPAFKAARRSVSPRHWFRRKRERDELEARAVAAAARIPGWLSEAEARELFTLVFNLAADQPVCGEIGSWLGKSSVVLATALQAKPGGKLYCVDPFDLVSDDSWIARTLKEQVQAPGRSQKETFLNNMQQNGVADVVIPVEGFSYDVAERFTETLDFLFIDGDHRYEGVLRDFALWSRFLKPGGVLVFHDYHSREHQHDGPRRVVQEWLFENPRWIDQRVQDSLYIAKKSRAGDELEACAIAASAAIPGWLSEKEARELFNVVANLSAERPVCCEIGPWLGKGSVVLGTALRPKEQGRIYSVDPFDLVANDPWVRQTFREHVPDPSLSRIEAFRRNMQQYGLENLVVPLEGYSHEVAREFTEPLDFLLIDGDHSYEGVLRDFALWSRFLKPGGIIGFHDYRPQGHQLDGPRRVIEEWLVDNPRWSDRRVVDTLYFAVKSRAGVELEATAVAAATTVPGWLAEVEARELFALAANLAADQPVGCEIGSWLGKSSVVLGTGLRARQGGKLYCVDPFDLVAADPWDQETLREQVKTPARSRKEAFLQNVRRHEVADLIVPLEGFSYDVAQAFTEPIDLLFIDGDHRYEAVLQDFTEWSRFLKPGGVVAFHDYHPHEAEHDGPRLVVEHHLRNHFGWIDQRVVGTLYIALRSQAGVELESAALAAADRVPGWLSDREKRELFNLAANLPGDDPVLCEIGSWLGKSSVILGTALRGKQNGKLYCVDPFDLAKDDEWYHQAFEEQVEKSTLSRKDLFLRNIRQQGLERFVIALEGFSQDIAQEFHESLDFLFIDGDHEYEAVLRDFTLWSRFLKPSGILAFHDYHPPGHHQDGPRLVIVERVFNNPEWTNQRVVDSLYIAVKHS